MATEVAAAYVTIGAKISGLTSGLAAANSQVTGFAANADKSAAAVGARFTALGSRMSAVGRKMTLGMTLPLVGIGLAALKAAADFEKSMSKITGLVGIAASKVAEMRKGVVALSKGTGKSASELAEGLFVVTSAGLRGADAMNALEAAGKASAAGLGATNDIARAVAGSINAYGSAVLDAAKATDIIVATARAGNFETSQFAASLGRVLPFAKQAGASLEEVGGAVALLTRTNGDAAQSITQVSALMRAFVVPAEEGKKVMKAAGLSARDMRDSIAKNGLAASLTMLDKALDGNRETLGRVLGSSEAAGAAFQILDADAKTLGETFGVVADSAGMTESAFAAAADTASLKMSVAMANIQSSLIEVGGVIAPMVTQIAGGISRMVAAFTSLPGPVKTAALSMAAFVAAVGPLLWMGGKVVKSVASIGVAIASMRALAAASVVAGNAAAAAGVFDKSVAGAKALGGASGGAAGKVGLLARAMPLLMNPLGLTVAAVGLGIAALVMFRDKTSAAERQVAGLKDRMTEFAAAMAGTEKATGEASAIIAQAVQSNITAKAAQGAYTAAVKRHNDAVTAGKGPSESEAQFAQRIAVLNSEAAAAKTAATVANVSNTASVKAAASASLVMRSSLDDESDIAKKRLEQAQRMTTAMAMAATDDIGRAKNLAELADAETNVGATEAKRTTGLKAGLVQLRAAANAIKNSTASDADKTAALVIVNKEISRTRTELGKVAAAPNPVKKITVDTADARRDIADLRTAYGGMVNLPNVSKTVTVKENKAGGGFVGMASGGTVRGPGGVDRVPAMLTAGEVVLNERQQALVAGGMSIGGALRATGAAFAKGKGPGKKETAKEKESREKKARDKARAKKVAAREKARAGVATGGAAIVGRQSGAILKGFDAQTASAAADVGNITQAAITAASATTSRNLDALALTFSGGVRRTADGAGWERVTGSIETANRTQDAAMAAIEETYKGRFIALAAEAKAGTSAIAVQFDALTPAEAALKQLQGSADALDLAGAMTDAQAKLRNAQDFGDPAAIAAATKAVRDAERAQTVAGLKLTAEAERAAAEVARTAATDALEADILTKQETLDKGQATALENQRAAGELSLLVLNAQLAEQHAADAAAAQATADLAATAAQTAADLAAASREAERTDLEDRLANLGAYFDGTRKLTTKGVNKQLAKLRALASDFGSAGNRLGEFFAKGITDVLPRVANAGKAIAKLLEDYLKTGSPTKTGPMSNLDTWFDGLAPALMDGVNMDNMQAGIVALASAGGGGFRAGTSTLGGGTTTVNLTVTDSTFAGMSRDQADRVAREVQAAITRQVRAGF